MASCAFPSSVVPSRLWLFRDEEKVFSSPHEWPGDRKRCKQHWDDETNKILDFAKLENDIIKNVLEDEEKNEEDETKQASNDVFPSFNYLPAPIPHSLIKSNPILKLYPRDHTISTVRFFNKQSQKSPNVSTATTSCSHKAPTERRRLLYSYALPKIQEAQLMQEKASTNLTASASRVDELLQCRHQGQVQRTQSAGGHTCLHTAYSSPVIASNSTSTQPPDLFKQTISMEGLMNSPTVTAEHTFLFTEAKPTPVGRAFSSNSIAPSVVFTSQYHAQRQQAMGKSLVVPHRSLAPRLAVREDQKKRKIYPDETVKTFAQIVAASRPGVARSVSRHRD